MVQAFLSLSFASSHTDDRTKNSHNLWPLFIKSRHRGIREDLKFFNYGAKKAKSLSLKYNSATFLLNSLEIISRIRTDFRIMSRVKKQSDKHLLLTHNWRHFALRQLRHRSTDRYLERCNIESCHIILAATFIIVVNDVLSHIIIWSWIFNMRLPTSTVDNEH